MDWSAGGRVQAWKPVLAILSAALLATAPFALGGSSCGHDFNFHLLSWMEVARAWHTGLWKPHWINSANYGAGEPRLIFYPPASWVLGGLLGRVIPWRAVPGAFVLLTLLGCGWSMYRLAREWLGAPIATFAACLYVANPYALFVAYERSAFAELLAGVSVPLIVLFALKRSSSAAWLGLAVAAVWLTDAPAAVMASYMLVLLALTMALAERKAWPAIRAAGGLALGLGLAAFYIVPAAYQRRWVEISRAIVSELSVRSSFLFGRTGDSLHDQVLWTASWILIAEMVIAVIAAGWMARQDRRAMPAPPGLPGKRSSISARIALTSLLPVILFLQFPASKAIWSHAPQLRFLQFPWRWLLVLSVAACLLAGFAFQASGARLRRKSWRWPWVAAGVVVFVMVAVGPRIFFQPCDDEDAVAAQVAAFQGPSPAGVEGTDEYTPRGADNSAIQRDLPEVRVVRAAGDNSGDDSQTDNPEWQPDPAGNVPANVTVKEWNTEHRMFHVESSAPGYAVLRLMDYPAWQVKLNGKVVTDRPRRDDGLMTVPVTAGSNTIEVRWRTTTDVVMGRTVSAAALLALLALILIERRIA